MILKKIRQYGVKKAWTIFYEYTIQSIILFLMNPFFRNTGLKNIIMIESHNDFDCNGGAFYRYLLEHKVNENYKIVWVLKHKNRTKLPDNVTWVRAYGPSLRKAYYNWNAKFLLADCLISKKLKVEQISVYLTHGAIALKSVKGKEVVDSTVDYVLAGSPNYDSVYREELSLSEKQQLLYFGFPCTDVFFDDSHHISINNIVKKQFKKCVLWMPTFRKGGHNARNDSSKELPLGIPLIETVDQYKELNVFLSKTDTLLIIKIHPMQDPKTLEKLKDMSNIFVLTGERTKELKLDIYDLIKETDALLSDYSSIAFQYLLLNRPIGFVLSDIDYLNSGLSVDNPEFYLTGHKIYSFDDLMNFIETVRNEKDDYINDRTALVEWLYVSHDGTSCKQLADFLHLV